MADRELEPLAPQEALDWYLEHRHDELRPSTRRTQRSGLSIFCDWTDEVGLTNLNELSGRDLVRFKTRRKAETDINTVSLNGTLAVRQRFLRFCETIDAVGEDLAERVPLPNVPPDEEVNTDVPEDHAVEAIRGTTGASSTPRGGMPSSSSSQRSASVWERFEQLTWRTSLRTTLSSISSIAPSRKTSTEPR